MPDAITPYNFVPLPSEIVLSETEKDFDQSLWHPNRHTGWLDVEYEALTPIFTRSEKDTVEFAHYGDQAPVLTGSSLRGMVRAAFEIFTASRMEFVADRRYYYRYFASNYKELREKYNSSFKADTRLIGGQLVETASGLVLRVSDRFPKGFAAIRVDDDVIPSPPPLYQAVRDFFVSTGERVGLLRNPDDVSQRWFSVPEVESGDESDSGAFVGWLTYPGKLVGRQRRSYFQVIAEPEASYTDYAVPDSVYEDYLAWGQMAHGNKFNEPNGLRRSIPRRIAAGEPAFGIVGDPETRTLSALGANLMLAIRYSTSVHKIRDEQSDDPDPNWPDTAQSVFGTVGGTRAGITIRGRVFFEDARWQRSESQATLPWLDGSNGVRNVLLSGPKPTAIQTYLAQNEGQNLRHWDSQDACLRGHKRYWHRSNAAAQRELQPGRKAATDTQRTDIRPVKPETRFRGRIRFENLTDRELGALLYATLLWKGAAHKFGMGKNLGLGSLKTTLQGLTILDPARRYASFGGSGMLPVSEVQALFHRVWADATKIAQQQPARHAAAKALFQLPPGDEKQRQAWDRNTRQVEINNRDNQHNTTAHNSEQWKQRYRLVRAIEVHRPG